MRSAKPEGIRPQTYYLPTLRRHAVPQPFPPGKSDQCLIQLTPTYKPLVRRQPITTGTVKQWSVEVEWALIECFRITDWEMSSEDYSEDI